ncbi:MAG TPA: hypothetical protein VMU44_03375 [Steroidobacteraceae bacterium]|nr:hypothetical protein [Steroidobacteraceae bacterium]
MPKVLIYETRRLVLPLETVVDAVLELDRERGGRLATASLVDARIEEGENAGLILELLQPDAISADARRYPLAAIAAAIIHYCWKTRVPLPRNWQKSIEIVPEGFALALQGTVEIQRRHGGIATQAGTAEGDAAEATDAAAAMAAPAADEPAAEPVSR